MRMLLVPLFGVALIGAGDAASDQSVDPAVESPETSDEYALVDGRRAAIIRQALGIETEEEKSCRDRISRARADDGLPPLLDREPASPDKPYLIYAVDRQQDGCSVMVMMGNSSDIRPLPKRADGPLLQRIPAQAAGGE